MLLDEAAENELRNLLKDCARAFAVLALDVLIVVAVFWLALTLLIEIATHAFKLTN